MKYSLILLAVIFFSSTCKRKDTRPYGPQYEEDPGPERGTTAERLQGSWRIEDYLKNGVSIYKEINSVASGKINLDSVYFSYTQATKDNGWHETRSINPWPWYFELTETNFRIWGYDSIFCYWFNNPETKANYTTQSIWKISRLYKNTFYVSRSTNNGNYKIMWKR